VTRYAQDARPYGLVTTCAAIATWLLLRALADGRWRWWAGYAVAIAATGLFNVLALLLAAHGTTVWFAHTGQRTAHRQRLRRPGLAGGIRRMGKLGHSFGCCHPAGSPQPGPPSLC
jgi:uncharacterized membrane protein